MLSVLLPTVQCSRYYWSNSSASVKLKIKVLLANIVAVCIGCSCPDFDCGEGAVLSLGGQELPYARYSSNGTGLSPAATLVVHLMITHLRKAQNTREQRRNEVLDRTVKTPRSGEKGKVVSRHLSRGGPVEAGGYIRNCIWWRAHSGATLSWRTWEGLTLQQEKVWRWRRSREEQLWTDCTPIPSVLLELQEGYRWVMSEKVTWRLLEKWRQG